MSATISKYFQDRMHRDVPILGIALTVLRYGFVGLLMVFLQTRDVSAQCVEGPGSVLNITGVSPGSSGSPTFFNWDDTCHSQSSYEIQILRLYNISTTHLTPTDIVAYVDWSEALTFHTNVVAPGTNNLFYLTLTEGTGFYVWRIRRMYGSGFKDPANNELWGAWTDTGPFVDKSNVSVTNANINNYCFYYDQFDDAINWIHKRSFGEGMPDHSLRTRISENMDYANYLLMPAQHQDMTHYYADVNVSQTVNDYSGRPSFQSMHGNIPHTWLGYQYNYILNTGSQVYKDEDYDLNSNYSNPSGILGQLSDFYSDVNSDLRIPSADYYPFGRTLYYNDPLNRPREIADPGIVHAMGNGATIKKYYGKPTTSELINLFGDEAPRSESVSKTYTKDPNGVFSIEYTDEKGQTIATCLTTPKSSLLDTLPSTNFTSYDTVTSKTEISSTRLLSKATYTFAVPTTLSYIYDITPKIYGDSCLGLCANCDYTITITAKERDEDYVYNFTMDVTPVIDSVTGACSEFTNTQSADYHVPNPMLDPGTYDVNVMLQLKNVDPATQKQYIDEMVGILHRKIDAKFSTPGLVLPGTTNYKYLSSMQTYLDNADINGLIDYIGADTSKPTFQMVFGCDTLVLPTAHCKAPDCSSPAFAQYMKDKLKEYDDLHGGSFFANAYSNTGTNGIAFTTDASNMFVLDSDAEFDSVIINMVADGYSCADLTDAWTKTVNEYIYSQVKLLPGVSSLGSTHTKFDWWQSFMTKVGYKMPMDIRSPGHIDIRKKPYQYFPYTWGSNTTLENAFCYLYQGTTPCTGPPPPIWYSDPTNGIIASGHNFPTSPTAVFFHIYNFYAAIKAYGISGGNSYGPFFAGLGTQAGTFNASNVDTSQALNILRAECMQMCDARMDDALGQVIEDFQSYGIKVLGVNYNTWTIPSSPYDSVQFQKAFCVANSIVEKCRSTCATDFDSSGYLSQSKLAAFEKAMFWQLDVSARPTYHPFFTCDAPYDTVEIVTSTQNQAMLTWLNRKKNEVHNNLYQLGLLDSTWEIFKDYPDGAFAGCEGAKIDLQRNDFRGFFSFGSIETATNNACTTASLQLYRTALDTVYKNDYVKVKVFAVLKADLPAGDSLIFIDTLPYGIVGYPVIPKWWSGTLEGIAGGGAYFHYAYTGPRKTGDTIAYTYMIRMPAANFATHFGGQVYRYTSGSVTDVCTVANQPLVSADCIGLYYYNYTSTDPVKQRRACTVCYDEQTCDGIACISYYPPTTRPTGVDEDPIPKGRTCGEIMCQGFSDAVASQIQKVHTIREGRFREDYTFKCLNRYNINDHWVNYFDQRLYQFTLYYYDRAGNLIRTVSPNGVVPVSTDRTTNPSYDFASGYDYTSTGQLLKQFSPDGGETRYTYDSKARLRLSQNADQFLIGNVYSYTKYDDLNRIKETGEATISSMASFDVENNNLPAPANCRFVTRFVYSTPYSGPALNGGSGFILPGHDYQRNLHNRVSYTLTDRDGKFGNVDDQVATIYSYDIHGNVEFLYQWIGGMDDGSAKMLSYQADILAGKPYSISLLKNDSTADPQDNYYMDFSYDGDSRLSGSGYSLVGDPVKSPAAGYIYNVHEKSQVRRMMLGYPLQGVDYTYTIEGWLKAINHTDNALDPGADFDRLLPYKWGPDACDTCVLPNCDTGKSPFLFDAFSEVLYYNDHDFTRTPSVFNNLTAGYNLQNGNLYNGNISAWQQSVFPIGAPGAVHEEQVGYTYRYDELNRLVKSEFAVYDKPSMHWNPNNEYDENFAYDRNGNMLTLLRNFNTGGGTSTLDDLTYTYNTGNNTLKNLSNSVSSAYSANTPNPTTDYDYDKRGNLTIDPNENLTIRWRPDGKVDSVKNTISGLIITYQYDAMGNRVKQSVYNSGTLTKDEYYIRDASANLIALYDKAGGSFDIKERYLYGAEQVGFMKGPNTVSGGIATALPLTEFELKDHLGNIRATVANDVSQYPNPVITSYNNYYAFGSLQPNRTYSSTNSRFGFNGQEMVNEISGVGNHLDFKFRGYDPRIGRFWSVDPLTRKYAWNSPYAFAENDVIRAKDLEGLERLIVNNVNAELRTAKLTIKKDIEIIRTQNLPSEYAKIDAGKVKRNFERGNTILYVKQLPVNGDPVDFISKRGWKKGEGYKLNVTYDVSTKVVEPGNASNYSERQTGLPSVVRTGNPWAPTIGAASDVSRDQNTGVLLNPAFNKELSAEDVITHEVGIHNMAGVEHSLDAKGQGIYPASGLESNQPGKIYPKEEETKQIINENTQRGRVDNGSN